MSELGVKEVEITKDKVFERIMQWRRGQEGKGWL